jgi:hypothetical protein
MSIIDNGAPGGTVTRLADTLWGGRRAVTVDINTGGRRSQARCVVEPHGYVKAMWLYQPGSGSYDEVSSAMEALATSWAWK